MVSERKIILEVKLFIIPDAERQIFPDGYKFTWLAYDSKNTSEQVRFDNHHGKAPHWHVDEQEGTFSGTSWEAAGELFQQKITAKFGNFLYPLEWSSQV